MEHVQTEAIQNNPDLLALIAKSTMGVYGSSDGTPVARGMRVRVTMNSGDVYEHTQDSGEAMHAYPTQEFLVAKFMDQFDAFGKAPKINARKIIDLALNIEKIKPTCSCCSPDIDGVSIPVSQNRLHYPLQVHKGIMQSVILIPYHANNRSV